MHMPWESRAGAVVDPADVEELANKLDLEQRVVKFLMALLTEAWADLFPGLDRIEAYSFQRQRRNAIRDMRNAYKWFMTCGETEITPDFIPFDAVCTTLQQNPEYVRRQIKQRLVEEGVTAHQILTGEMPGKTHVEDVEDEELTCANCGEPLSEHTPAGCPLLPEEQAENDAAAQEEPAPLPGVATHPESDVKPETPDEQPVDDHVCTTCGAACEHVGDIDGVGCEKWEEMVDEPVNFNPEVPNDPLDTSDPTDEGNSDE